MFLILLLFFNFCYKNLHIFALPSSAVLKPAQAGLVHFEKAKFDEVCDFHCIAHILK
jgi:hypothetical protein